MTQYDILRLAQEAGMRFQGGFVRIVECVTENELRIFAALVAAAERRKHQADIERWKDAAMTAEKWRGMALGHAPEGAGRTVQEIQREAVVAEHKVRTERYLEVMRKAIEEEREQCAKVAEDPAHGLSAWRCRENIATAIRARSEQ